MTRLLGVKFEAMALNMPRIDNHPNKMPFSGVLTRLDTPSDGCPHGTGGRKIIVTKEAGQRALGSLLGMACGVRDDFTGHDARHKVGLITGARIEGNALLVDGFIYRDDFPTEARLIKEQQANLGFSFEARNIDVADMRSDPLEVVDLVFTGAAIMLKNIAAYTQTSLAAARWR